MKLERGDFALFWNLECGLPEAASCYIYKKDLDLEGCFFLYSRFTPTGCYSTKLQNELQNNK